MKKIPMSGRSGYGRYAVIDDDDYNLVAQYRWHYKAGYASTNIPNGDGTYRGLFMHRLINATPAGMDTDHINGVGLDNRRSNLRSCSHAENCQNRPFPNRNLAAQRLKQEVPI